MFKFYVFKEHFSKISKVRLKKCNKILRGVIFGIFSDVSNTQKLPGPCLDSPRPSPGLSNFGLVHPLNICTSCNVNSQLFCLAVAYSFTPGPISYHKRMEDVDIQKMWPTFFYFRFPPPWYTPSNSLLYDIGEFLFLFSPFLVQNCHHRFFFFFGISLYMVGFQKFWHLNSQSMYLVAR